MIDLAAINPSHAINVANSLLDKVEGKSDASATNDTTTTTVANGDDNRIYYKKRSKRILCFTSLIVILAFLIVIINMFIALLHKIINNDRILATLQEMLSCDDDDANADRSQRDVQYCDIIQNK